MSTVRVSAAELRRLRPGSLAAHEALQEDVLTFLKLNGWPAMPIHTGPRVRPRSAGGFELKGNRAQRGLSDVLSCMPPSGRLLLIELKTGQASRSKEQLELQLRFAAAGARCLVVRSVRQLALELGLSPDRISRAHLQGGIHA